MKKSIFTFIICLNYITITICLHDAGNLEGSADLRDLPPSLSWGRNSKKGGVEVDVAAHHENLQLAQRAGGDVLRTATSSSHRTMRLPPRVSAHGNVYLPPRAHVGDDDMVFFLHIPKTGGTTLQFNELPSMLNRTRCAWPASNQDALIRHHLEQLNTLSKLPCNVFTYEAKAPMTTVVESLEPVRHVYTITFLRDPMAHLISEWAHEMRHKAYTEVEGKFARGRRIVGKPMNLMTRVLQDGEMVATDFLRQRVFSFGLLEYWNASICLFLWQFKMPAFSECSCSHAPYVTKILNVGDQMQLWKTNISLGRLHWNYEIERPDRLLYLEAHQLFLQRVRAVEKFEKRRFLCVDNEEVAVSKFGFARTIDDHVKVESPLAHDDEVEDDDDGNAKE